MLRMQRLRQARTFARLVLAWFALALGVAIASPVLQGHPLQPVCTGGTIEWHAVDADGEEASTLDCPLCVPLAPPAPDVRPRTAGIAHAEPVPPSLPAPVAQALGSRLARGPPAPHA